MAVNHRLEVIELHQISEVLGPEALKNACDAYERVIATLNVSELPATCDLVAERIVTIARAGITDPDRLYRLALTGLVIRKD